MKKYILLLLLIITTSFVFVGCNNDNDENNEPININWISPMISIEKEGHMISLWNSEYDLHRNETFEVVFRQEGSLEDIAITSDMLIEGGAVPATLRVNYGGEDEHMVRFVAFAYSFFDHGRPTRLTAHAATPNPQEIMILWRNPENGHWFNLIQNGIGHAVTLGQNHNELVSLRNDNPVYTFLLNKETVNHLSEIEVFIVATVAPTREDEYERSGYSIMFALELPDIDNHFHSWEILAATGTMLKVEE